MFVFLSIVEDGLVGYLLGIFVLLLYTKAP